MAYDNFGPKIHPSRPGYHDRHEATCVTWHSVCPMSAGARCCWPHFGKPLRHHRPRHACQGARSRVPDQQDHLRVQLDVLGQQLNLATTADGVRRLATLLPRQLV